MRVFASSILLFLASTTVGACSSSDSPDPGASGAGGTTSTGGTSGVGGSGGAAEAGGAEPCNEKGHKLTCEVCCASKPSSPPQKAYLAYLYQSCRCEPSAPCLSVCSDNFCAGAEATTACKECPIKRVDPCTGSATDSCVADPVCKPYTDCVESCQFLP